MRALPIKKSLVATCVGLALSALVACGGGSGGESAAGGVTEDTDLVVRNAARTVSSNVGVNMNSIQATADNSSAVSGLVADGNFTDGAADAINPSAEEITSGQPFDDEHASGHEQTVRDFVLPTLEGGNATRTRTADTIVIDPDEQYVCQQWSADDLIDGEEVSDCAELLSDFTVRIDADTDDTGNLSYLFAEQNLLVIKYGPTAGSYELFLPAVKTAMQRAAVIAGEESRVPEVMEGALKLSASVLNDSVGVESGSMSVAVTQPVRIASVDDDISLEMGSSSAFSVESDAASGDAILSVKVASMKLSMPDVFGSEPDSITRIEVPDFTLHAELRDSGSEVLLTDSGFGAEPMTLSVNDQLAMSLVLANTSALFDGDEPMVSFLESMSLDLQVPDLRALLGGDIAVNSSAALALNTTAGTVLRQQDNSAIKVDAGGPFNVEYSVLDGENNSQGSESFLVGECFQETSASEFVRVSCE